MTARRRMDRGQALDPRPGVREGSLVSCCLPVGNGKVNLAEKLQAIDEMWSPAIVGRLNDYKVQVVKVKGEFVWHSHPETDEFFLVLGGRLTIQLRDGDVRLGEGEMYVVPRGVEHCPAADAECHLLLIEPAGTPNTGDARGERTAAEREV